MKAKLLIVMTFLIGGSLLLSACQGMIPVTSVRPEDEQATQSAYVAQAAQATATTMAMQTLIAHLQTQVAQGNAGQAAATATPAQIVVTQAVPTNTPLPPTVTPVPPTPTPTATVVACNAAQFVGDVTIPDGSTLAPGSTFVKTWRLKNVGSCTWTTDYDLVFVKNNSMNGPADVNLLGNVAPGEVIDVSVTLKAPSSDGKYRGDWKLRTASGVLFGVGKSDTTFYVDIKVSAPQSKYPLDFIASMCNASWTSGAGSLPCPGAKDDAAGFVMRVDKPTLETGYVDDEAALATYPQMINDGVIRGKYPSFRVENGHHFQAIIGCGRDQKSCDVNFQLDYQIGDGSIQTLKTWHEVYDEQFNGVDVDLSSLAGKDVKFILTVFSNGSSNQDWAQWLAPRIVK